MANTNLTERQIAEAARRRAIELASLGCDHWDAERVACVKVWNEFCEKEARRLARKDSTAVKVYETYRRLGWA